MRSAIEMNKYNTMLAAGVWSEDLVTAVFDPMTVPSTDLRLT